MAQAARLNLRLQKELKLLITDPPPLVSLPLLSDDHNFSSSSLSIIEARIEGPEETVYSKGVFTVKIQIPERYPFQPPNVTFATPIYHPNIDNGGRICLDILNLPPKGAWTPSLNISTVLTSIGLLLSEPNPDDGLMAETSREYKYNRQAFNQKARSWTERYANAGVSGRNNDGGISANQSMMDVKRTEAAAENAVDGNEGRRKKLRLTGDKLSLKSTALAKRDHSDNKENVVPTRQLSLSHLQRTLAGSSSSAASQHAVKCEAKSLYDDAKKAASGNHQQEGGSSNAIETIIVSDSEESGDEDNGISTSRLSLMRKQSVVRRKGQ